MPVPNTFANATATIPLSQLDANFATTITLGNTAIQLGNTVTTLNNMTLANVTISSGNVTITTGNITVTNANVTTANVTDLTVSNSAVISVNTSGNALRITQTGAGNALVVEDSANPDATPFVIDTNGRLVVGYSTPITLQSSAYLSQFLSAGNNFPLAAGYTAASATGPKFTLAKNRSTDWATQTVVVSGDTLGEVDFMGSDGTNIIPAARIGSYVDSTPGTNDMPGRLVFSTTADGASTPTERMRIDSSGNLGLGVTPSAWRSNLRANQVGLGAVVVGSTANSFSSFASNYYTDASSVERYINTDFASQYYQLSGAHVWRTAASGTAGNAITFTQAMTLTSAGELLVGGTTEISAASALSVQKLNGLPEITIFRNDTSIVANDVLGQIAFYGNDTTSNTPTLLAGITAPASGTHAAGDNPTDLAFFTTPDGSATVAEAGRITQSGAYVLKGGTTTAAAGVGIIFPATQVASANANCLDDYEEGTFTPTIVGTTTAGTGTYNYQVGRYTKIGNRVCINILIDWTAHTGTGNIRISGLPFTSVNVANTGSTCSVMAANITSPASTMVMGQINQNSTQVTLYSQAVATSALNLLAIDTVGAVNVMTVYEV